MYQFNKDANSILVQHGSSLSRMELSTHSRWLILIKLLLLTTFTRAHAAADLPALITQLKPSVVAIALYNPTAAPRLKLLGSGFVVGPGNVVVTNYHVISTPADIAKNEAYVVLSGHGQQPRVHQIKQTRTDARHDLALLEIDEKLPAVKLADAEYITEGTELAFTGYPITGVLGLYPATHRALLSAVTPIVIPADHSQTLSAASVRQMRDPFLIYQLDGTAYPGNSGSMLYRQDNGAVVGIINMVLIKKSKEAVLSDPSGISYAIPVKHLHQLLQQLQP
ncbi:serine protease [Rheinheimera texasensis]|uniref:S1 family peptidase n=1 Tax=Rheinheimera texasensis TaxID=306205 RepID=UPI0032B26471